MKRELRRLRTPVICAVVFVSSITISCSQEIPSKLVAKDIATDLNTVSLDVMTADASSMIDTDPDDTPTAAPDVFGLQDAEQLNGLIAGVALLPWAATPSCSGSARQQCTTTMHHTGRFSRHAYLAVVGPYSPDATDADWQNYLYSYSFYRHRLPPAQRTWLATYPSHGRLHGDAWNHWRPTSLTLLPNKLIRLQAIWSGNVFTDVSKIANPTTCASETMKRCDGVEPDVAPTACVTIDIDPIAGMPVAAAIDVEDSTDWIHPMWIPGSGLITSETIINSKWQTPLKCAAKLGITNIPKKEIAIDLDDGSRLVAYPGRSQWEAVMTPGASPAKLLRDVFGKDGAWSTAPVVEIFRPTDFALGNTPTAVPLDLNICRVSEAEVAQSGCACTQAQWPPKLGPSGKPKGDNWAVVEVLGTSMKYVIDEPTLVTLQGNFFTAAGHTKLGQQPSPSGGTMTANCALPQVEACCWANKKCSSTAFPSWSCGAGKTASDGSVVLRGGMDTRLASNLFLKIDCYLAWSAADAGQLKTLPASFPPTSFASNPKNGCGAWLDDGFAPRDQPPGQRHRAWATLSTQPAWMLVDKDGFQTPKEEMGQMIDIEVISYGPKHLEVEFVATGVRMRYGVQYDPLKAVKSPPTPKEDPNANVQRVQIRVHARFTTPSVF